MAHEVRVKIDQLRANANTRKGHIMTGRILAAGLLGLVAVTSALGANINYVTQCHATIPDLLGHSVQSDQTYSTQDASFSLHGTQYGYFWDPAGGGYWPRPGNVNISSHVYSHDTGSIDMAFTSDTYSWGSVSGYFDFNGTASMDSATAASHVLVTWSVTASEAYEHGTSGRSAFWHADIYHGTTRLAALSPGVLSATFSTISDQYLTIQVHGDCSSVGGSLYDQVDLTMTPTPAPEPCTLGLLIAGGLLLARRRK